MPRAWQGPFQSTPSYEGERQKQGQRHRPDVHFNPLPHTRENLDREKVIQKLNISIHSLIRGRTVARQKIPRKAPFQSTPSYEGELVPSMSTVPIASDFNPLPHTRENYSITFIHLRTIYFNPLPHTRENFIKQPKQLKPTISIHSLIRGRTQSSFGYAGSLAFQSTPSYEGELYCRSDRLLFRYFNPLPHTRENTSVNWHSLPDSISIHSLIRGRTRLNSHSESTSQFQSTPSYEGEQ